MRIVNSVLEILRVFQVKVKSKCPQWCDAKYFSVREMLGMVHRLQKKVSLHDFFILAKKTPQDLCQSLAKDLPTQCLWCLSCVYSGSWNDTTGDKRYTGPVRIILAYAVLEKIKNLKIHTLVFL